MSETIEREISLRLCLKREEILMEERGMWFEIKMGEDCKKPIPL